MLNGASPLLLNQGYWLVNKKYFLQILNLRLCLSFNGQTRRQTIKDGTSDHFLHPFIPVIRREFPWCKIVFNIAKHNVPFLRGVAVFHNQGAAQF